MIPEFDVEWSVFQYVLISLALGAIVGLERQTHQTDDDRVRNGIRTFALASLLGTTATLVYPIGVAISTVLGLGFMGLIVAHYLTDAKYQGKVTGITTETAAMITFALGALVPSRPLLAAAVAVIVAGVLSQKKWIHRSVERMTRKELYATIKLLLVSIVFLPLLPQEPIDPWGIYVPRDLWFLVVLISAISFVGYFAMRVFGSHRGIAITGLVGGLASSTAVTLSMSERVKETESADVVNAAAFAIVAANAIMLVRVYVEITVVDPSLALAAAPALGVMFGAALLSALAVFVVARRQRSNGHEVEEEAVQLDNPFRLGPALKFGLVFVIIIGLAHGLREIWGDRGLYVASVLGGLADSDATVLTAARLRANETIDASTAVRAVVLASISNSLVKAGLATFLGSLGLGARVLVAMLPLAGAAVAAWLLA